MAKLIIRRGDALDRKVDLDERTVRIGRADQNDIVLPDAAKSVSRAHAELRFEHGAYVIVDLNSQNGVWVEGQRVPQATLEPGVPVVLGCFTLVLEQALASEPVSTDATLIVSPGPPDPLTAGTMVAPVFVPPALAAPPISDPVKPAAPKVPARSPGAFAAPPKPAAKTAAQARPAAGQRSRTALIGGVVVLCLAVLAGAVFLTPLGGQLAEWTGKTPGEPLTASSNAGAAASPVDRQPATELARPTIAQPPVERPVAAPVEPQAAATQAAPTVPAQMGAAPPPGARPRSGTSPAVARTPASTGRGTRGATAPGAVESRPKPPNLAQQLEAARAAMNKGDYPAAIAGFEAILAADPTHPNAAELLGVARGGARSASQLALDSGARAEAGGDYTAAAVQYERALRLDPGSTSAPEAMRRLRTRMQAEGEDAFRRARQYDALGRAQDAISMYERAIQLLPPEHANVKVARQRLTALRGGL